MDDISEFIINIFQFIFCCCAPIAMIDEEITYIKFDEKNQDKI